MSVSCSAHRCRKMALIPWNWGYGQLSATMWCWELNPSLCKSHLCFSPLSHLSSPSISCLSPWFYQRSMSQKRYMCTSTHKTYDTCIHAFICMHIYVYIYIHKYTHISKYMCTYLYIIHASCVPLYMCMTCICMHMHISTNTQLTYDTLPAHIHTQIYYKDLPCTVMGTG